MPSISRVLYMRAWLTGVALGILPVALLPHLGPPALIGGLLGMALLLTAAVRRGRWVGATSGLLIGVSVALAHGHALQSRRLPLACESQRLTVQGWVSSLPRFTRMPSGDLRQRFELAVDDIAPLGCGGPRRILVSWYDGPRLVPGEYWRLPVRLTRPRGLSNPGSFNMQAWYASSGIDAVGTVRSRGALRQPAAHSSRAVHHRLRQQISERLSMLALSPDSVAILKAVTVADRSGLDYRLWSLLQRFGVNHLIVISGLHIGMVAGLGYFLGGIIDRLRWLRGALRGQSHAAAVSAMLTASAYAALAGFTVSTQRALCMLACFLLAAGAGRRSSAWNALRWSLLLVLATNPLATLDSGFWLSFGAVSYLLLLGTLRPGGGWLARLAGTHLYMSLVMLPLTAWWFGGASLGGAVANLLLVPLIGFYVVPLALLGGLCCLLNLGVDLWLWRLAGWPLEQLLPLASAFSNLYGDAVYARLSPELPAFLLAVSATTLVALRRAPALKVAAVLLAVPLLLPAAGPRPVVPALRLTVLDVGQGTAVVVRNGANALLYDTGGGDPAGSSLATSVVLPYLRQAGVVTLDTLLLSHPDADHSAGSAAVLDAMPVTRVLYSSGSAPRSDAQHCRAGVAWRWPGGASFQLLSPPEDTNLSSNNGSCVLRIDYAGHRLLLPGDIESAQERQLVRYWGDELASHWLLAPHHGSKTSSSYSWIKWVRPDLVVFSHGYGNRFGHPHEEVVRRYGEAGVRMLATATSGALEFTFLPAEITVQAHRDRYPRFWR
jgi:competence protein ComEC